MKTSIKTAYIIGAGLSKAYEDSPTGIRMPIATDFFKAFNELDIAASGWVLVGNILNYCKEKFKVEYIDFGDFNKDIEVVHSMVYEALLESVKKDDQIEIFDLSRTNNQLLFLFASVLNEIQNGPVSIAHVNLVNQLNEDDALITFNWDTLLDRALNSTGKWYTDSGYGITPTEIFRDGWTKAINRASKFELLKLHGSTNWLTSHPINDQNGKLNHAHSGSADNVFVFESSSEEYSCYDGRYMSGYEPFSYGYYPPNLPEEYIKDITNYRQSRFVQRLGFNPKGTSTDIGVVSMPLIIPPTKNKEYSFFGDLFPNIWQKAEQKISAAERIIIAGYSFPITDIHAVNMMKNAFMKRKSLPKVVVINPSPARIVDVLVRDLGIPIETIIVDESYINKTYNFRKYDSI